MLNQLILKAYYASYSLPTRVGAVARGVLGFFKPAVISVNTDVEKTTQLAKTVLKQLPRICAQRPAIAALYKDCFRFELEPVLGVGIHRLRSLLSLDEIEHFVRLTYRPDRDDGVCMSLTTLTAYTQMLYQVNSLIEITRGEQTQKLSVVTMLVARAAQFWPSITLANVLKGMELEHE